MSSTLQIQLDPKLENVNVHWGRSPMVFDPAGNVDNDEGEKKTNKDGFVDFAKMDPGPVYLLIKAEGFEQYRDETPIAMMPRDGEAPLPMLTVRLASKRGFLTADGLIFRTDDGQPWPFMGYTIQTPISEIAAGRDVGARIDEAKGYGANTIVAICMNMGQFAADHGFWVDPRDPNWPNWVSILCDLCAERGMRLAPALFQQAKPLSDGEKRDAWAKFRDVLRGRWNVLGRMGNENNVNDWDPAALEAPSNTGGVLYSSGSRGINNPPRPPNFDWAEWEPPREPRAKTFSDAGGAGWYMIDGYPEFQPPIHTPLVCIEPPFFHESEHDQWGDKRWTNSADALTLGLNIGANFAGGAYGCSEGLECRPAGPNAQDCARQFFRGLKAGFVR